MDQKRVLPRQSAEAEALLVALFRNLLSSEEIDTINQQFNETCRVDSQVLWSGIPFDTARIWAKQRNLQTLTTAMGPLMDVQHPSCLKNAKSGAQWSLYIKGASALFASHIAKRSARITVLLPPPPETVNPNGPTNYELIERPVVQGAIGGCSVRCMHVVHPTVQGAEQFEYQSWPIDRTEKWIARFALNARISIYWRSVKITSQMKQIMALVTVADSASRSVANLQIEAKMPAHALCSREKKGQKKTNKDTKARKRGAKLKKKKPNKAIESRAIEAKLKKNKKKKLNKEIEARAIEAKLKKKNPNKEMEARAIEAKLRKKKLNKEIEARARKAKLQKVRDKEAKKQKKGTQQELTRRAKEVTLPKKRVDMETAKRAKRAKMQSKLAKQKAKKASEEQAKREKMKKKTAKKLKAQRKRVHKPETRKCN